MGVLNDILTARNGIDFDNTKIYTFLGIVFFLGLSCYGIYADASHHFSPVEWGSGFGLIVGLGGAGTAIKAHTEPSGEPDRKEDQ